MRMPSQVPTNHGALRYNNDARGAVTHADGQPPSIEDDQHKPGYQQLAETVQWSLLVQQKTFLLWHSMRRGLPFTTTCKLPQSRNRSKLGERGKGYTGGSQRHRTTTSPWRVLLAAASLCLLAGQLPASIQTPSARQVPPQPVRRTGHSLSPSQTRSCQAPWQEQGCQARAAPQRAAGQRPGLCLISLSC